MSRTVFVTARILALLGSLGATPLYAPDPVSMAVHDPMEASRGPTSLDCVVRQARPRWWTPARSEGLGWLAVAGVRGACALWCSETPNLERRVLGVQAAVAVALGTERLWVAARTAPVSVQCTPAGATQ